jgi:LuxR family transcriptional regulator, activator of conjugal transfer of Ti plasmids
MFASGAFVHHDSRIVLDALTPAERAGLGEAVSWTSLIGDLPQCRTQDALRGWLLAFANRHGFGGARYLHLGHFYPGQRSTHWKLLRFLSTHDDRADLWLIADSDPGAVLITFLPFAWDDASRTEAPQRDWYAVHGLEPLFAGITVPVQDHAAGPACLILYGGTYDDAVRLVDAETPMLTLTALSFHLIAKTILAPTNALGPALSDREIACLRLAALGDTLADTAAKLGVSTRTVEFHLGRVSKKLNASNKVQAAAIAVSAGLIQI